MIKLIIFDLGKVILDFSYLRVAEGLAVYTHQGLYRDPDNIIDYMVNKGGDLTDRYEEGKITSEEFFACIKRIFKLDISFPQFRKIWNGIFTENEGISNLIEQIKDNFTLFLLSNTNELHFEYIKQAFPVVHKFDKWVLSYQAGVRKPDPGIYQIALDEAGVKPGEAIFIDDIRGHVRGAQGLGIKAVEFQSVAQITRYIKENAYEH